MPARNRYFATLQARGLLALPPELRRRYRLDEPGSHIEIIERGDGVIELRPRFSVPADQAWFWSNRWQGMEREVDEHVEGGETTVHADGDELVDFLDELRPQD